VAGRLLGIARRKRVPRVCISGGEPVLCKRHLLAVLECIELTGYGFILEINGISIGADEDYADLARYACAHIRVSLRASTVKGFEAHIGARGGFWEQPFTAVERLLQAAG
jgi:uncharacterized Fe-S cluster-containing radical SAM superfamily protein